MFLVLCTALVHGTLYLFIVPPWQHYDEPTHFEYARLIADRATLPRRGDYDQAVRREIAASMVEYGFYRDLEGMPDLLAQGEPIWLGATELVHPPLYYLTLALPLRLVRHTDVTSQLYVGRLVSLSLYLLSIWLAYRIVAEIVPPGHPLRWVVSAFMALLPAYTDLMTAVNNDVGAVVLFSLFLWGAVRTIVRGVTLLHLAWLIGTAALCVYTKSTAAIAVVLVPIILVLALSRRPWHWPVWAALALVGLLLVAAFFTWGDAALWQRHMRQASPTSQAVTGVPLGHKAIALESPGDEPRERLVQSLPAADVEALQGVTATLGAWIWANVPVQAYTPGLHDAQRDQRRQIQVGPTPSFHAFTTTVSPDADEILVVLYPPSDPLPGEGTVLYFDGVVLAEGERPLDVPPSFHDPYGREGSWGGQPFVNLVRNGSGEVTWPYVRSWADDAVRTYARRSLSRFLASLLDWERTSWLYQISAMNLLQSFWARFGWGHVALPDGWYRMLGTWTVLGAAGAIIGGVYVWRSGAASAGTRAVAFLALAGLLLWANALLRAHPVEGKPFIPAARYAYPAIVPTALALLGGWWALTPKRFRRWLPPAVLFGLGLVATVSLWTLVSFYGQR